MPCIIILHITYYITKIYYTIKNTLHKIFWVFTRRRFLVYDRRFGTTCLSHLQVLFLKTLKMGQTSSLETAVIYQKKKRRRVKTQKILCNITTAAEAFNHIKLSCCLLNDYMRVFGVPPYDESPLHIRAEIFYKAFPL
jgi:hypothetical protein